MGPAGYPRALPTVGKRRALHVAIAVVVAGVGALLVSRGASGPGATAPPPVVDASGLPLATEITPDVTALPGDGAVQLLVFSVPVAGARFRVVDLGMGRDLGRALEESGASLVVNGGFFDPAGRPEGLVISEGETLSARSDSLGGGVVLIADGRAALSPAEGFVAPPGAQLAVQARPRLVVDGGSNIVHDDGRAAARTALCIREQGRQLDVVVARGDAAARGPTLARLAELLVTRGCEGALNLDGGPSTGVAWRQGDQVHVLPPRGPLRHAIAVWAPPTRRRRPSTPDDRDVVRGRPLG